MSDPDTQTTPRRKFPWRRWLGITALLVATFLVWFNGPGVRWLGPKIAAYFLGKSGIDSSFTLRGSLLDGIEIADLDLDSASFSVVCDEISPLYRISELIKGKADGLTLSGLDFVLKPNDNPKPAVRTDEEESKPIDADQIAATIRSIHGIVIPYRLDLRDITFVIRKDDRNLFQIGSSNIRHEANGERIDVELGPLTDATGKTWTSVKSDINWTRERFTIARLDPLPGIAIRDFILDLPETARPSAATDLTVDDAAFHLALEPGFSSARIDQRSGTLAIGPLLERFGVKLPATAKVTSLAAEIDQILPNPISATGELRLQLDDAQYEKWRAPSVTADLRLQPEAANLIVRMEALDTEVTLDAEAIISRTSSTIIPGKVRGSYRLADLPAALSSLKQVIETLPLKAKVPASFVEGSFNVAFANSRPSNASAALKLVPEDSAAATGAIVAASWAIDPKAGAVEVSCDGFQSKAKVRMDPLAYSDASLELENFKSTRLAPWLVAFGINLGGEIDADGRWSGEGDITQGIHRGALDLTNAIYRRSGSPDIVANGRIEHDWPLSFRTNSLTAECAGQKVELAADLADNMLQIQTFTWQEGESELAGGSAKLPVPADFSRWREMLAKDERPIQFDFNSKVIPLQRLQHWIPETAKLDAGTTGEVRISLSGTYPKPSLNGTVTVKNLKAPEKPELPTADLGLRLETKSGALGVNGELLMPGYAPAVLNASLPFRPDLWANDPAMLNNEPVKAKATLPRLDLSRFLALVKPAKSLAGIVTGEVTVAGTIGTPEIKGSLALNQFALTLKDEVAAPLTNGSVRVEFTPQRVELKSLRATAAAGVLDGAGTLDLVEGKPGPINIRLKGQALPVVRNDSMIVRANADLRISGPFEAATVSGSIGLIDSLFYRDIELIPIGQPFLAPSAAALPKIDPPKAKPNSIPAPFDAWKLDVTAKTIDPILIRGNLATGSVDVNLKVGGTPLAPAPDGTVMLNNVTATLPFSTLRIRKGTLEFSPAGGLDPALEIRGRAEPRPYTVNVFVTGRASEPQLVLTSSPPLPENEIMTLLATGATTSDLENPELAQARAMKLLAEEIRRGRFVVGKRLRPILGLLDRVDFSLAEADPYSSDRYSSATIAVTDKWFLSAGLGEDNDTRVMGIWKLRFR